MILEHLESRVIRYCKDTGSVVPRYDGHSLSNIPSNVLDILTSSRSGKGLDKEHLKNSEIDSPQKVVLFYIDGISYDITRKLASDPGFFGRMVRKGSVSPITAVFPSTTAASCTTLNTGLTPAEHTLLEWQLYYHETGALIYTLPFRAVTSRYSRRSRQLDPDLLFRGEPIYSRLRNEGVKSFVFVNRVISRGQYSDRIFSGSTVVPYSYITDCMIQLRKILEEETGPLYAYVYIESADAVGHTYGPETEMYRAEINSISRIIRYELLDRINPLAARDVAVMMTSDHGQVQIDPKRTYYLNSIEGVRDTFEEHLGSPIPPVGSPRDLFLHVRDDLIDDSVNLLERSLEGTARLLKVSDAVRDGLFGDIAPSETFYLRSGNLMILPLDGETVWYRIKGQAPMHLRGLHGGLSREEMIVPFGAANLSRLL